MLGRTIALAGAALLIEAAFGYPQVVFDQVKHPVVWVGALLGWVDRRLNDPRWGFGMRRASGIGALLVVLAVTAGVAFPFAVAARDPLGWCIAAVLAASLPAQRSLAEHVRAVAEALDRDGIEAGRRAVSKIVGRDTGTLDAAGVARAAIESLAENFSDGVVAPAFWLAVGGLTGGALYKAINTADSMIGHRSERHQAFGWAAARLDDLVNLPASRLAALWLIAATCAAGCDTRAAWSSVWRDAGRHRSPNAGWPEAAMAGALGVALAGPRLYGGLRVADPFVGGPRRDVTSDDIRRALRLYRSAAALQLATLLLLAAMISIT